MPIELDASISPSVKAALRSLSTTRPTEVPGRTYVAESYNVGEVVEKSGRIVSKYVRSTIVSFCICIDILMSVVYTANLAYLLNSFM